ncbi:NAD(P)-dependent alcohol dehydrogenase [Paenibacillus pasadenensis]|uniref:NAD(P)-dependent alcohol dehydrogenase n=1 Tax=Paenibacillus pasadenensis TaxID=217090 RepID=UPI00203B4901|nr:NAD(P)-dependent alcohol dehydrogenase [Paenibacillus pasadenensis]MCM3747041.1 NAD(P)-dependent alcohol dehydrogenase [Paenibacillus pasadenensis]
MKAILCTKYGPPEVLELRQTAKPKPKGSELLVKVRATTVTTGDCRVRSFRCPLLYWLPMRLILGIRKPRNPILGVELAGVVEAVGPKVKKFRPGDEVYALSGMRFGAHAEYVCLHENGTIALKPDNLDWQEAAAIPFGATTALYFFRKSGIGPGKKVLVYGASGAVGTAAVQIAAYYGAEVTAVCSGANTGLVRSLGANHTIDYTKEDFADRAERYDIVFDTVGKCRAASARKALAPGGAFLTVEGKGMARTSGPDLVLLKQLAEEGHIRAVIERTYPLEQIQEAHRHVETGRKKGNIVVVVSEN